jgi:hypothetical protein
LQLKQAGQQAKPDVSQLFSSNLIREVIILSGSNYFQMSEHKQMIFVKSNTMKKPLFWLSILALLTAFSCNKEDTEPRIITLINATVNGSELSDGLQNVETTMNIELIFSSSIAAAAFESAFSLKAATDMPDYELTYISQATRVRITAELQAEKTYTLQIEDAAIGQNGEQLEGGLNFTFTTAEEGIITSLPPCTSGNINCLQTVAVTADGTADLQFYSSFPIYEEMARWESLTAAVIVIHGINRNANDYFNYLMQSLQAESLENNTVLIAPFFKSAAEAQDGEHFWSSTAWREGQQSSSSAKASSFEVVDQLIAQLANKARFPVLEKIVVTGHSSGGLFTHLFAAANTVEAAYPDINFDYVVANSQYFYYPDGQRVDENTNQLYIPAGCTGYDLWPMGYAVVPPYVGTTNTSTFNTQFVQRNITYLLGNGSGSDSALNTTDCYATLLGSSRYKRGENMYQYMELAYPGTHNHSRVIVDGIGHDGAGMYSSATFKTLLKQLIEE